MIDKQQKIRPTLRQFLDDERGVMAAEYGLLMIIACGCLAVLAFKLGDRISAAFYSAADTIKAEAALDAGRG